MTNRRMAGTDTKHWRRDRLVRVDPTAILHDWQLGLLVDENMSTMEQGFLAARPCGSNCVALQGGMTLVVMETIRGLTRPRLDTMTGGMPRT